MKQLYLVLIVSLLSLPSYSQKNINKLIDHVKKHDSAIALTLPGWLMRSAFDIAADEQYKIEKGYADIVDGIKKLRVVVIPDDLSDQINKVDKAIALIKEKEGYQEYATIKDGNTFINVIVKERKNRIRNLVVTVKDDESLAILNILTNINMEQLKKANLSFNKNK